MTTQMIDRMAVEVDGSGDAVIMIHGLGGTSNTWAGVMPFFERHQAIRLDLPGSGRSHRVEGALSIDRFVQAVLRVASATGAQRAHVVGHSMGCIVALHLAAREPKLVRSLALFGPLLAPPDAARNAIRARGQKARGEGVAGMQAIADTIVQSATSAQSKARRRAAIAFVRETLMRQEPDGYARTCEALAEAMPADPAQIKCPTLLVTGDEDVVAPVQAVRQLQEHIADSRMEVLRGCGHWEPIEQPDECVALLRAFHARLR